MCGKNRKDTIRNESFQEHLGVASIWNKTGEIRLRWFGHVQRKPAMAPLRKSLAMQVDGPLRGRGRTRRTWMEVVQLDLKKCNLSKDMVQDRSECEKKKTK